MPYCNWCFAIVKKGPGRTPPLRKPSLAVQPAEFVEPEPEVDARAMREMDERLRAKRRTWASQGGNFNRS